MWMTGENKGRYFMKIRRFIAAVLAVLALSAFAGCKKHDKDQTDTTEKNDETVSEDNPESTASVADVNADIKNSRYFLGIDLDGWYHWNKVGDGFQDGSKYTSFREKKYNSRGDIVSSVEYEPVSPGNYDEIKRLYEYTYNSDGTVKEIRRSSDIPVTYRYEYDNAKRISKIFVSETSYEAAYTMTFSYNKNGKPVGVSCNYWSAAFLYDGKGNLIKNGKKFSDGIVETVYYEYNDKGDVMRKTNSTQYSDSSFKGVTEYEYDENGALIKLSSNDSYGTMTERVYKNDAYGNPVEIKETKTSNGDFISSYSYTYSYEYETAKISVTRSDGDKKIYEYQKNESILMPESAEF